MLRIASFLLLVPFWAFSATVPVSAEESPSGDPFIAPVRAVDVFDDSLLVEPPAQTDAEGRPVLEARFDEDELADDWMRVGGASARKSGGQMQGAVGTMTPARQIKNKKRSRGFVGLVDGPARSGRSLRLAVEGDAPEIMPSLQRILPAAPHTGYRLSFWVRADSLKPRGQKSAGAGVEIRELAASGETPILVHQHLPRERGTSSDWKRIDYAFRTSENTHRLRLDILGASNGSAAGSAFFDDLVVLEIPAAVELLLPESSPFRSSVREGEPHPLLKRPEMTGNDFRPAVIAPGDMTWKFPVLADQDTLLRFSVGMQPSNPPGSELCFHVFDGEEEDPSAGALWRRCLTQQNVRGQRWIDAEVDFADLGEGRRDLMFRTEVRRPKTGAGARGAGGQGPSEREDVVIGLWGNPRLVDRTPGDEDPPNIVLLVFDTLRADHLGAEGYDRPTSPALDRLAARSVRFSRAYTVAPWTAPSMSSLLTSRYPNQHGGGLRIAREHRQDNPKKPTSAGPRGWENRALGVMFQRATGLNYYAISTEITTLAEILRRAGYETNGFYSNYNTSGVLGLSRGYDRYQMFSGVSKGGAGDGVNLVLNWLRRREATDDKSPYYLFFHTQDPHIPYRLRREQAEIFGPSPIDFDAPEKRETELFRLTPGSGSPWAVEFWNWGKLRQGQATGADLDHVVSFYDSEIAHADHAAERLIDEILRQDPNTVIVVVSDHGEEFGEHGQYEHGHSLYDEVLRVPLWVRLPGDRHGGAVIDEPVSIVDVLPTVLQIAGLERPEEIEGSALFAVGPERTRRREGVLAEAMLRGPDRTALVEGRYKYVFTHPLGYLEPFPREYTLEAGLGPHQGREELYDLIDDPGEKVDLAAQEPEVSASMRRKVLDYLGENAYGLHVRCGGSEDGFEVELEMSETLSYVKPLTLESEDELEIDAARRRLTVRSTASAASDEEWWIARYAHPGAQLRVRARSGGPRVALWIGAAKEALRRPEAGVELDTEEILAAAEDRVTQLPETEGPWCRLWQVATPSQASGKQLDSEVANQLRALGYL